MRVIALAAQDDFDGWRKAARALAAAGVPAREVSWQVGEGGDLFGEASPPPALDARPFPVPRAFLALAESAILHADPERFALLYALLLRLKEKPEAMADAADPLLHRIEGMAKAVRRDIHKLHAFLRFREIETEGRPRFVAWFEPDHHVLRAAANNF
jgi:probable DNA metabolism protein